MTTLSVIVPATDSPPTLSACLDAIRAADDPPEEVIVVTEGDGPAAARNQGASRAIGDVLVFVDADVLPHADAFTRIRAAFDADVDLAALFGSYDDDPPAPGTVSGFRNLLHHHVHQEAAGPATTFWAGLGAVRLLDFREADGFDAERYPRPSVEDIDLGSRLVDGGAKILLDPELQGRHLKAWTLPSMIRTDFWQRGVPWTELLLRHGLHSGALNLGWRHRASAAASIVALVSLVRGRLHTAAGALVLMAILNRRFYSLLARRRGRAEAALGVGLHVVHHATGALSVPVGIARHLSSRDRGC